MFKTILRTTTAKEIDCDMCIGDACQRRISLPFIRRSLSGARLMKSSSISVGASEARARVRLHNGEELQLERAGDLGKGNAGMLIFGSDSGAPEYVPWTDVERIDLDRE